MWAMRMAARLLVACKHVRTALRERSPPQWALSLWNEDGRAADEAGAHPGSVVGHIVAEELRERCI